MVLHPLQALMAADPTKVAVLDVRPATQFALLQHPCTELHVMYEQLGKNLEAIRALAAGRNPCAAAPSQGDAAPSDAASGSGTAARKVGAAAAALQDPSSVVFVVCRRGNNSQRAVVQLREQGVTNVVDVVGGMEAWAAEVNPSMPVL